MLDSALLTIRVLGTQASAVPPREAAQATPRLQTGRFCAIHAFYSCPEVLAGHARAARITQERPEAADVNLEPIYVCCVMCHVIWVLLVHNVCTSSMYCMNDYD